MKIDFGVKISKNEFARLRAESPSEAVRAVSALAEYGRSYVVQSFGASPSSPGDPPGVDTGALRASLAVQNTGPFERAITVGVEYGQYLEYGTERMAARPFMRPMALHLETVAEGFFWDWLTRMGR